MLFKHFVILSFIITQFFEIILINLILKFKNFLRTIFLIFLFNSFTHPLAIYLYVILSWNYFLIEGFIVFIESIFYKVFFNFSWQKSITLSFCANTFSILVGLFIKDSLIKLLFYN